VGERARLVRGCYQATTGAKVAGRAEVFLLACFLPSACTGYDLLPRLPTPGCHLPTDCLLPTLAEHTALPAEADAQAALRQQRATASRRAQARLRSVEVMTAALQGSELSTAVRVELLASACRPACQGGSSRRRHASLCSSTGCSSDPHATRIHASLFLQPKQSAPGSRTANHTKRPVALAGS